MYLKYFIWNKISIKSGTDIQSDTTDKRGTFILMLNSQKKITHNIYKFRQ